MAWRNGASRLPSRAAALCSAFIDSGGDGRRHLGQPFDGVADLLNGADGFIENNYLSTDIRVPVTLTGTNSGRAVGTNGMRGQMWDNFSSEDYKTLPAVGPVPFFNPYSGVQPDSMGMNDVCDPALLADSGPATPSIAPFPNLDGSFAIFFSMV